MPRGIYKRMPEHNAANSKSKKGENNPMYGRHHSDKTRDAMSVSHTDVPLSPAHCAALSAARKGIPKRPHSPEHNAAISKAHTGVPLSPEHIAVLEHHWESMRGGNDIVDHHYIYDHDDLSKYTMKMTRSAHTRLHWLMRKTGIKVPHINMGNKS